MADKRPPPADADEDPNVEEIELSSPPCFAHELDDGGQPRKTPAKKKKKKAD